jgi:hypothetical protein
MAGVGNSNSAVHSNAKNLKRVEQKAFRWGIMYSRDSCEGRLLKTGRRYYLSKAAQNV